jgi:hypothetical protein
MNQGIFKLFCPARKREGKTTLASNDINLILFHPDYDRRLWIRTKSADLYL